MACDIPGTGSGRMGITGCGARHPEQAKNGESRTGISSRFLMTGTVLGIAQVTERVKPGVIHCYTSSGKYDPLEPGKAYSPDGEDVSAC